VREGWIRITDIANMTLDEVDTWNLYLDALEEARMLARRGVREES
jgi:hypothetical protein